jgi:protein disulfide-isomerase-like protein
MMMRSTATAVAISILLITQGVTSETLELDDEDYQAFVESGLNGMIKFYQPWCGFCKQMKPAWDQLGDVVNESVFIADVNCSEEPDLCASNGVRGYPTIKVILDGQISPYEGGRSFEELYEFVDEHLAMHCIVERPEECDKKSQTYMKQWKDKKPEELEDELNRLDGLMERHVTYGLKRWMKDRSDILRQLLPIEEGVEEE